MKLPMLPKIWVNASDKEAEITACAEEYSGCADVVSTEFQVVNPSTLRI